MTYEKLYNEIRSALVEFEVDLLKVKIREALNQGISPEEIIRILSEGMDIVGKKYQTGEYFVTSLIIAGETMKEALEVLEPHLGSQEVVTRGKIVVATVAGDIHNIGKNIFTSLMETAGFEVIDLGVDVSAKIIVSAVRDNRPDILGLSALLTTNLEQFPLIVKMLKKEELRDQVKIVVGGATVTREFATNAGVDAHAKSAIDGVNICKKWI
jgi:5-methyltetrahydrofolate--homocysteine methyltransferase